MKPPAPPPEHPIIFDSVLTEDTGARHMFYASITKLPDDVLIRGVGYDIFILKTWDFSHKEEERIVHPMAEACYFTLELKHDSINHVIYIGYNSRGKFYSYYRVSAIDFIQPPFIYLSYKKQIFPSDPRNGI
jgi:hypothetical protein